MKVLDLPPKFMWLLCIWLLSLPLEANLLQKTAQEYQIKATYLFNFSYFVTWPISTFHSNQSPFIYCVLGKNPFDKQLNLAMQGEKVDARMIETSYLTNVQDTKNCQIIFIAQSEAENIETIVNFLKKYPVLTVSDLPDFINRGGMIRFYTNQKRQIRIAIEHDTLKQAGLKADANLLRVSKVVKRGADF